MQNYLPPEGYLFDRNSGLYYQTQVVQQDNGSYVQWVTWFNAETGTYSQYSYPYEQNNAIKDEQKKVENEQDIKNENLLNPPDGFVWDWESGLYYQSIMKQDETEKPMEYVTWFDAKTGEYAEVGYPISIHGQKRMEKADSNPKGEKSSSTVVAVLIVIIVSMVVFGWKFKWYEKFPIYNSDQQNAITTESTNESNMENEEVETENFSQQDMNIEDTSGYEIKVNVLDNDSAVIRLSVPEIKNLYPAQVDGAGENDILYSWRVSFGNYSVSLSDLTEHISGSGEVLTSEMTGAFWKDSEDRSDLMPTAELKTMMAENTILWEFTLPENNGMDLTNVDYTVYVQVRSEDINEKIIFASDDVLTSEDLYAGLEYTELNSMSASEDSYSESNNIQEEYPEDKLEEETSGRSEEELKKMAEEAAFGYGE